jgi:molybdopterin/thiamine biosynthesis adenylyltransferase
VISPDLVVNHSFSARHATGYPDYYAKFTTYVQILSSEAQRIEPSVSACTFPPVPDDDADSPFRYLDTASSRAGLSAMSAKLAGQRLAIVGLGGTGSYVLDLVSKTPVREIHLIDADTFCNHNAFRSPGAATLSELEAKQAKVNYLAARYGHMHCGLHAHQEALTADNMGLLSGISFAFLCLDDGVAKGPILGVLERDGIPYIDVGMGLREQAGGLAGQVRVTAHSAAHPRAASDRQRIPISAAVPTGEYATNIQIAELNALNAALAVIRWKKMFGFYADTEFEHNSVYVIDGNTLVNGDRP